MKRLALATMLLAPLVFAPMWVAEAANGPTAGSEISYEDRVAITDLILKYSNYYDSREAKAWAALFVEDGDFSFPEDGKGTRGHIQGRAKLEEYANGSGSRNASNSRVVHFAGPSLLVPVSAGVVHARTMMILGRIEIDKLYANEIRGFGLYEDEIVKTPEGWRFKSRAAYTYKPVAPEFLAGGK